MNHEFSVEEMGEDGLVPIDDERAADIVGASIRFHFTSRMAILIARFYMRHSMRGVTTAPEIVRWNATDVHV
jgi:hypothetical protein